jgi:hypothetical protein
MKKLFLALLAMVAFVACEKTEDGIFAFDKEGNCIDKAGREVSAEEFAQKAVGYCWVQNDLYEIFSNGTVSDEEYHKDWLGYSSTEYFYFMDENSVKSYTWRGSRPVGGNCGYRYGTYSFENSEIYFADNQQALYRVLEITDNSMTVILHQKYLDNGSPKMRYLLTTFTKLTEEKHQQIEELYWVDWEAYDKSPEEWPAFKLRFDENGLCYCQHSDDSAAKKVATDLYGYGWIEISSHLVLPNGCIEAEEYAGIDTIETGDYEGVGRHHLVFDNKGVVKDYYMSGNYPPEEDKGYSVRKYSYDGTDIYAQGAEHISYQYRIIGGYDFDIWCLRLKETPSEANGGKYVYTLNYYRRMTEEQLAYFKQTYTRNWDEE